MKVAIYARVSSDRQAEKELSIPAQIKAIQQYCQERDHIIVNEFIEKRKSVKTGRINFIQADISAGRSKPYYSEMLAEMQQELQQKQDTLSVLCSNESVLSVPDAYFTSTRHDIQTLVGLLGQDVSNPQLLHSLAGRFISKLYIQRETERVYMTVQFRHEEQVMYEKTVVDEWR